MGSIPLAEGLLATYLQQILTSIFQSQIHLKAQFIVLKRGERGFCARKREIHGITRHYFCHSAHGRGSIRTVPLPLLPQLWPAEKGLHDCCAPWASHLQQHKPKSNNWPTGSFTLLACTVLRQLEPPLPRSHEGCNPPKTTRGPHSALRRQLQTLVSYKLLG